MHVVFISACEKRALVSTRRVLDSFALRTGERSWASPVTAEGLVEIRKALRRVATRHSAVACYRNDGRARMRLLWVVGNRDKFGLDGAYPVATSSRPRKRYYPQWVKAAHLLATVAGLAHDLGKLVDFFQKKLDPTLARERKADPVRHEWVSVLLIEQLLQGVGLPDAWRHLSNLTDSRFFKRELRSPWEALLYVVATHHQLPEEEAHSNCINTHGYVRDRAASLKPAATLPKNLLDALQKKLEKLKKLEAHQDPGYWRQVATLARAALILADHTVSAEDHRGEPRHKDAPAYANTLKGRRNQALDWHLERVGQVAGESVLRLYDFQPPALAEETLERIREPATAARFKWQDEAAHALRMERLARQAPVLVLNIAGTGAGKTLMNLKAIEAASGDQPVRAAVALSLRTLTLQTGDAYKEQLRLSEDELACVIGDRVTRILHDSARQSFVDEDENETELEFDVRGPEWSLPDWLKAFAGRKPYACAILNAPTLVSTADFLVNAGEPDAQGNHVLALMRLMTSDLILDEIDSYEPEQLIAMLRLVTTSASWGRNVVLSSATLSWPIAAAIWRAYRKGLELRAAVEGTEVSGSLALISDLTAPRFGSFASLEAFKDDYQAVTSDLLAKLAGRRYRMPRLVDVCELTEAAWRKAILDAAVALHRDNHFVDPASGKRVSFGLIRVANIHVAVPLARYLARQWPAARVACYHSQLFALQRFHLERRLDYLLDRTNGNARILADLEIRRLLQHMEGQDAVFLVVATPVEEIGRNHDFDWSVIEPSSSQSLAQTAGRTNRHRLLIVVRPNVAILRYNFKFIQNKGKDACFSKPGLESEDDPYSSHDLAQLLDWRNLDQLDAALRLGGAHALARHDDESLVRRLRALSRFLGEGKSRHLWMSRRTYSNYPLRDNSMPRDEWTYDSRHEVYCRSDANDKGNRRYVEHNNEIEEVPRTANDLFVLSKVEILDLANELGIQEEEAFSFTAPKTTASRRLTVDCSFGAYLPKER